MYNMPASERHSSIRWPWGLRDTSPQESSILNPPECSKKSHQEEPGDSSTSFTGSSSSSHHWGIKHTHLQLPSPSLDLPLSITHLLVGPFDLALAVPLLWHVWIRVLAVKLIQFLTRESKLKVKDMCLHVLLHGEWRVYGQEPVTSRERFRGAGF